jgi:hypothetical protein
MRTSVVDRYCNHRPRFKLMTTLKRLASATICVSEESSSTLFEAFDRCRLTSSRALVCLHLLSRSISVMPIWTAAWIPSPPPVLWTASGKPRRSQTSTRVVVREGEQGGQLSHCCDVRGATTSLPYLTLERAATGLIGLAGKCTHLAGHLTYQDKGEHRLAVSAVLEVIS